MPNIRDIAKRAGVSVTTVSRVLNDQQYVSEEKRNAVIEAINHSNYQKNINAVHLSKGKTNLIGVVIPFSNHPYFGLLLEGIASEALNHNHQLVLFQSNYEPKKEKEALDMLKHKQVDALIICSRITEWDTIERYNEYGPVVVCEDARGKVVSSTFVNHYQSFTLALALLHRKGHRKMGYCIGRSSGTNSHQRERAYNDFLKKLNEPFHSHYVFSDCFHFEDGEKVVNSLVEMTTPPSALLVTSDQVAAGILTCCHKQGISVPEDLAIVGFDNQPIAKVMNITTIEIPLVKVGQNLFRQALKEEVLHEEIQTALIERGTV
ncbi:LacI family DNA-binding transcriptional regulator [Pseudalkalibacillus berkeleyi]|uniref:LacI family DNA-binding transcriptional regulator n=1 Tax=Pseudalkalibacillus berkeleyi TaxID=1069813 RepID=A0ABS9H2W9_9BACL|nr:LacI family DNA-binding transcriptional regulator [Pseudalkalibacillus berkeleyi]MCF6138276.1 LacI family DNA-binding transcriptional regulator [Pseudalkalibacillus berkeleyi]